MYSCRHRGFLPTRDPLKIPPPPFDILSSLAQQLPKICSDGTVRAVLNHHQAQLLELPKHLVGLNADALERVHALYSYLSCAYVRVTGKETLDTIPRFLAKGWVQVSRMLDRRPMMDYSDCVLYNWERLDKEGPISMENIRILHRFTGVVDEEHFFKTHIILESEASGVVSSVLMGMDAFVAEDTDLLLHQLSNLEAGLFRLARVCLPLMFQTTEDQGALCDYFVFFHELRHFISSWDMMYEGEFDEEKQQECGPSGAMSSILPAVDAFLGIEMSNQQLSCMLRKFENYVPSNHRGVLNRLRAKGSIRNFVEKSGSIPLVSTFNACINRVLDFRWRHLQFIQKYLLDQMRDGKEVKGTGGTPAFRYLYEHIHDTEKARIEEVGNEPPSPQGIRQRSSSSNCVRKSTDDGKRTRSYWEVGPNGFLCARTPSSWELIKGFDDRPDGFPAGACDVLRMVANAIPSACVAKGDFHELVQLYTKQWEELHLAVSRSPHCWDIKDAERAHSLISFVVCAYNYSCAETGDDQPLPESLEDAWRCFSKMVDRPCGLDYTDLVLNNWNVQPHAEEHADLFESYELQPSRVFPFSLHNRNPCSEHECTQPVICPNSYFYLSPHFSPQYPTSTSTEY